MLGQSLALAIIDTIPTAKSLRSLVKSTYNPIFNRIKSDDSFIGNPIGVSSLYSSLPALKTSSPFLPITDVENSYSSDMARKAASIVQSSRVYYEFLKRRVRNLYHKADKDFLEKVVTRYLPSMTFSSTYDSSDPRSILAARGLAVVGVDIDIMFSIALIYHMKSFEETPDVSEAFANPAAVVKLTSRIKATISSSGLYSVKTRKIRASESGQEGIDFLHPVFVTKPLDAALETWDSSTGNSTVMPFVTPSKLVSEPKLKELLLKIGQLSLLSDDESEQDVDATKGIEVDLDKWADKIMADSGGAI